MKAKPALPRASGNSDSAVASTQGAPSNTVRNSSTPYQGHAHINEPFEIPFNPASGFSDNPFDFALSTWFRIKDTYVFSMGFQIPP